MSTGAVAVRRVRSDDTWRYLDDPRMPAMAHGWKLHVSARPAGLGAVVDVVLATLAERVCHIKHAKNAEILRALNSGGRNPGAVGKAVTVYPRPDEVPGIAAALVAALGGREGPRIPSDRRVDPGAPVYYRYGPFEADVRRGSGGRIEMVMAGPGGEAFDGFAVGEYRCPPWALDPFTPPAGVARSAPAPESARLLGARFRVTAGLARAPQGDVYRAVDTRDGSAAVVKQARAFVGEDAAGADARVRLRNELRALRALDGVPGIPRVLDYFRHGTDEFLAMTDCGRRNLRHDVLDRGPHPDVARLAADLLRILDAAHARGVVVRDIKPGNVVFDPGGRYHLIDFGIAHLDGTGPGGATPGYSMPVLRTDSPAEPADDYYALGATLAFVLTGLDPVIVDPAVETGAERTLAGLGLVVGGDPSSISRLMSPDPAVRAAGAALIRTGGTRPTRLPSPPHITADLLDEVIGHTVGWCVEQARTTEGAAPIDVYAGSSGLGWELLRHGQRDEAVRLAQWTAPRRLRGMSAGFYSGRGGVAYFLAEAGVDDPGALPDADVPRPDGGAPEADVVDGAAGAGLSHVLLAGLRDRDEHLAAAGGCAALITSGRASLGPSAAPGPGDAALADGVAHGRAGVAHFLLAYAAATGDPAARDAAREACAKLAAAVPDILAAAVVPGATRRYASWCRGLAGIGAVLARAAHLDPAPAGHLDPAQAPHLDLAHAAADVCVTLAPRVQLVGACCGLAGVGELLVDLARWDDAEHVARIILTRSGGPWSRPVFPNADLDRTSATWAGGSVGVLGFFRRLRDRGGPRLGFPA